MPMIALFTDFGLNGPYVGQVHAVIEQIAPEATVIDLMHDVPRFDVRHGAYLLAALAQQLPPATIAVCVVDPGVGGDRQPLMLNADNRWYVGPDNGLFSVLARGAEAVDCRSIDWRPTRLSDSFHGRDLFAPVAARLALGLEVASSTCLPACTDWPAELAEVIYVDGFGNAMTGIGGASLDTSASVLIGDQQLRYARVFAEADPGVPFWYVNSLGLVEVAGREIDVAELLALEPGTPVTVRG